MKQEITAAVIELCLWVVVMFNSVIIALPKNGTFSSLFSYAVSQVWLSIL